MMMRVSMGGWPEAGNGRRKSTRCWGSGEGEQSHIALDPLVHLGMAHVQLPPGAILSSYSPLTKRAERHSKTAFTAEGSSGSSLAQGKAIELLSACLTRIPSVQSSWSISRTSSTIPRGVAFLKWKVPSPSGHVSSWHVLDERASGSPTSALQGPRSEKRPGSNTKFPLRWGDARMRWRAGVGAKCASHVSPFIDVGHPAYGFEVVVA